MYWPCGSPLVPVRCGSVRNHVRIKRVLVMLTAPMETSRREIGGAGQDGRWAAAVIAGQIVVNGRRCAAASKIGGATSFAVTPCRLPATLQQELSGTTRPRTF